MSFCTVPQLLSSAVEQYGDARAIVTAEGAESFAQLGAAVIGAARMLQSHGVERGDRILIAAANSQALIHAWLGAIWCGAIPAAVNPASAPAELEYFKSDLQPRLVLSQGDIEERFSLAALADKGGEGELPAYPVDPLEVAAIVYTSGTTSRPKGVLVRHAAYTESGLSFPTWIKLAREERLWACLPLFHINAQAYSLMSSLAHGYSLAVSRKFHATSFWQEARDLRVTSVNVVGAMLEFVARQDPSTWVDSSLRTIYTAPGPRPEQRRELEARFRVRITSGYGMTENPFGCAESPTSRDKPRSIGRPRQPESGTFENKLRIVRSDATEATEGEEGELWFQNPVMTPGYWNASEISKQALAGGWLHTGDAGYRDRDGDVFLSGRYKDMIRRRGENISPAEVEDVLAAHQGVESVAVFGVDAGLEEEEVMAVVVARAEAHVDEPLLKAFAATRLAPFKVPSKIVFRQSLPMTPTHRVAKDVLRREYERADRP